MPQFGVLFVFAYRRPVYFASVLVVRKSVALMERDRIGAASMHTSLGNGGGSGLSVLSSSDDRGSHIIHPSRPPTSGSARSRGDARSRVGQTTAQARWSLAELRGSRGCRSLIGPKGLDAKALLLHQIMNLGG